MLMIQVGSCETEYKLHVRAFNRICEEIIRETITAKTNGSGKNNKKTEGLMVLLFNTKALNSK